MNQSYKFALILKDLQNVVCALSYGFMQHIIHLLNHDPSNMNPSIYCLQPLILLRVAGGLEPFPANIGQKAWYTRTRLPIHHRTTYSTFLVMGE